MISSPVKISSIAGMVAGVMLSAFGAAAVAPVAAQAVTEQQLIEALREREAPRRNRGRTRGFTVNPSSDVAATPTPEDRAREAADQAKIEALTALQRRSGTRAFTSKQHRTQLADLTVGKPTEDMEIYFDFNSSVITPKAEQSLQVLARAMQNEVLADRVFAIAGHTDAKGKASFNLGLSQRRAAAVRDYLVKRHGIEAGRLLAAGYGEERLKLPNEPHSGVNRRVQITNIGKRKLIGSTDQINTSRR